MLRHTIIAAALLASAGCSGGGNAIPQSAPVAAAHRDSTVKIVQFADLPNSPAYYFPVALCSGPGKALWVADDIDQDAGESAIVRINTAGKRTATYYYPNSASPAFNDITPGPDGALWIADSGDGLILRMTTTGTFTHFSPGNFSPLNITSGPDGALWFTEVGFESADIGRITTAGTITTFTKGLTSASLQDITTGPDGALWFTEPQSDTIGRITTHGRIKEFSKGITPGSKPYSIITGPDGALWFTEMNGRRIDRITTSGEVTEYSHGITGNEVPNDLAVGSDGAIWFTEYEFEDSFYIVRSKIARITTTGTITEYSHVPNTAAPTGIVQGPDGNMWFVEMQINRLGRVNLQ